MKLKFKNQDFQEAATAAVCDVFEGQPYHNPNVYMVDPGRKGVRDQEPGVSVGASLPGFETLSQAMMEHLGLEHLGLDLWKCVIFRRLVCLLLFIC